MVIIRDEHRSIEAVLNALQQLARTLQDPAVRPRFEVLRAMIYYIAEYPERLHHPKEDEQVFARLAARAPEAKPLLEELAAEHVRGRDMLRELEHAALELEQTWPRGAAEFAAVLAGYAEFHWRHMRREEDEVLPLAERRLTAEDWRAIGEAFAGRQDPVADLRAQDFERLFARIVALAPEPIGLAERWEKDG
jgi:hemerythrin-like domain-containing protein